jgi:hypothetical protein
LSGGYHRKHRTLFRDAGKSPSPGANAAFAPYAPGFVFGLPRLHLQSPQLVDVDLSANFLGQLDDLQSAEQINRFLPNLLILGTTTLVPLRRSQPGVR